MSSSKALFAEMQTALVGMDGILKDNQLTAEVQTADINWLSWILVGLTQRFNQAVAKELSGLE